MKTKNTKQTLASVGLSLLTAIVSTTLCMILGALYEDLLADSLPALCSKVGIVLLYLIWTTIITVACYFICKRNPGSVWYSPVLCNFFGIISAVVELKFWITIFVCGGFIISLIGAIAGAKRGKRNGGVR